MAVVDKYVRTVYIINFLTLLLGLASTGISAYIIYTGKASATLYPLMWYSALGVGIVITLISWLGWSGANTAKSHLRNRNCQCRMSLYLIIVFVIFGALVVSSVFMLTLQGKIGNATAVNVTEHALTSLDRDVMQYGENHPQHWIVLQDTFKCCGWNSTTDDLATGSYCPDEAGNGVCRSLVLTNVESDMSILSAVTVLLTCFTLVALIGTCCLTFASRKDAYDEQLINSSDEDDMRRDVAYARMGNYA